MNSYLAGAFAVCAGLALWNGKHGAAVVLVIIALAVLGAG